MAAVLAFASVSADYRGRHLSIARYGPEGTIVSSGMGNWCGAGGWRLGTFVFPLSRRWLLAGSAGQGVERQPAEG